MVILLLTFWSCTRVHYLAPGEKMLHKQRINGVESKMKNHMSFLYEQNPNSRLLWATGPAHLFYIYDFGKKHFDTTKLNQKKQAIIAEYEIKMKNTKNEKHKKRLLEKKLKKESKVDRSLREGNQLMRWGEALAVFDEEKLLLTKENISQYLHSRGYFDNKVDVQKKYKGRDSSRVKIAYSIKRGPEYLIDSIQLVIPDPRVKELYIKNFGLSGLKKRKIQQIDLAEERDRVHQMMVNNGYFSFSKELVHFQIDSVSLGSRKLLVRELINNPPNQTSHKLFEIDTVVFVTDAGFNIPKERDIKNFRNITYTFGRYQYATKVLDWHTYLYPNKLYKRDDVLKTQRQLSYTDNFKFINIKFDTLGSQFIANILASPSDRFQTSTEVGLSRTQGVPGPFANLTIKNRNLFGGLEIVKLNANFKVVGLEGVETENRVYSSFQYKSELSVIFPQFFLPLGQFYKKKIANFNPQTRFRLAVRHEDRLNEYKRTSLNTVTSYIWKVQDHIRYNFTPMNLSFINSETNSSFQVFLDTLALSGSTYINAFNSAFVSSGSFQLTVNNDYGVARGSSYLQLYAETGGYLLSLLGKKPFSNSLEYYKYAKASIDFRKSFYLNRKTTFVTRLKIGVAIPASSNNSLPYSKYFFAGGSNSLRAWKVRRLGPGAYGEIGIDKKGREKVKYQREQPGDMAIEISGEIRQKLTEFMDWALFTDAGNVWLLKSETINPTLDPENDDGIFKFSTFAQEIAVGSGLGLRFDLSLLIFRLDFGWKFIDPAQPLGKRWVGNRIFPNLLGNAEINIGIGYPF